VEWARDAEDEDDDWDGLPRRRQRQRRHRRRVAAVAIGAGADFTQLDGGTDWDRHNGGDHVEDVWDDVRVDVVVAGSLWGALSPRVSSCSLPPFTWLTPHFPCSLGVGEPLLLSPYGGAPPFPFHCRRPAVHPHHALHRPSPPTSTLPTLSLPSPDLSRSRGTCFDPMVQIPAHCSGGIAFLGSPDPLHFYLIYFVDFHA